MTKHAIKVLLKRSEQATHEVADIHEKTCYKRFLRFLVGDRMHVLIISPGPSVRTVEVVELSETSPVKN